MNNIAETHYINNDNIHIISSQASWASIYYSRYANAVVYEFVIILLNNVRHYSQEFHQFIYGKFGSLVSFIRRKFINKTILKN